MLRLQQTSVWGILVNDVTKRVITMETISRGGITRHGHLTSRIDRDLDEIKYRWEYLYIEIWQGLVKKKPRSMT